MKRFMKQKGFTLIETVIYMGILLTLLLALTQIFNSSLDVQLESEGVSSIEQDGRFILSRLYYDVLASQSVTTPATLGAQTNTIKIIKNATTYTYTITGNDLTISDEITTDPLNSFDTTVSALTATRIGSPSGKPTLQIKFTLTGKAQRPGVVETKSFQTTVGTR